MAMQVKGSSVVSSRDFVKEKFGDTGFKRFLETLPEASKKIYTGAILSSEWYSLQDALHGPTKVICDTFYRGDPKGAWEMGNYSAEKGLRGIYKFFIKLGSPEFIAQKASTILPTYYKPCRMSADIIDKNKASVKINEFAEISPLIEHRVHGWISKALELTGRKGLEITINKALSKKDPYTEYVVVWE
jgi:hypothetical protein